MVRSERLCFLWCLPSLLSRVDFYDQTIVGIVSLVSLQVLKTLPAFDIVLIVKICCGMSPKLVFLSMYDKLKLKNDATYEEIN